MSRRVRGIGSRRRGPRGTDRFVSVGRLAVLAVAVLLGCETSVQEPAQEGGSASLAVSASVVGAEATSAELQAAFESADSLKVRLVQVADGSVLTERTLPFEASGGDVTEEEIELSLESGQVDARLELGLLDGSSLLFTGESSLTLVTGETVTTEVNLVLVAGQLEGRVTEPLSSTGVEGVTVSFASSGSTSSSALRTSGTLDSDVAAATQSTTTASDGSWTSPYLGQGTYDVVFEDPNRENTTLHAATVEGGIQPVSSVPLVPASDQTGTVSGVIQDASTGVLLSGATVELRPGVSNPDGEVVASTTAGDGGSYFFDAVPAGTYTLTASDPDHAKGSRTAVSIGGQQVSGQDLNLVGGTGTQIVLTWGETPRDLDAHLRGPLPDTTARFHVWYSGHGSLTSLPYAQLDQDVTSSYGPETITIAEQFDGTYRYAVHDYTNHFWASEDSTSSALANSGATVEVYQEGQKVAEYFPPSEDGTEWIVFEMDGSTSAISRIDSMRYENYSDSAGLSLVGASLDAWMGATGRSTEKDYEADGSFER